MKFTSVALTMALLPLASTAFQRPSISSSTFLPLSHRASAASPSVVSVSVTSDSEKSAGRTNQEIEAELQSGRVLEGGKVMDFEAVKGPSRAEHALYQARQDILRLNNGQHNVTSSPGGILGINQDVIDEVGHELGMFATQDNIQNCASFLRSQAPSGLFKTTNAADLSASFTAEEKRTFDQLLRKAYEESGEVTGAFAKTFYMGTMLLPEKAREAIWAIYVWCRRTDEIVDAPRDDDKEMLLDLSSWELRLEKLWDEGAVEDVYDLCLLDVRIKYPTLSITPFMDMIRGMLMDVPGLGQDRYDNFDELHLYCYRVAGTVGLMSLPVFGCAPGITDEQAR